MLTRGKRPRSGAARGVAITALVIGLLIAAESTVRGDGYDMALQLQRNVALLTVTLGDKTHYGFGFVVGETDERLLVVTARHVVPRGFEPSPSRSSQVVHQGVLGVIERSSDE